ncbi:MAG: SGNH/GDSL hydrolase family protein [Nocardioidaceae bacterium]|nr:SGNH/GDSL hydrolase family protein [Nocardioidaceae bacterium]
MSARSSLSLAMALLVCGAMLAGCGPDGGADSKPDAGSSSQVPLTAGDVYVALGDSYTSAPKVARPTGPGGCLQTEANYPRLLAKKAGLELTDVSCGGASTGDLAEPQTIPGGTVPAQLDAVTDEADLVTISIGGNNAAVFSRLVGSCVVLARRDPQGSPCTDQAKADPGALEKVNTEIRTGIEGALKEIGQRAPHARVIVVGYPQIFPDSGTCAEIPLAPGDYPFGRSVMNGFIQAQQQAAKAAGVEFLDLRGPSKGHDICAEDPWLAGIIPAKGRPAAPFHPYAEEQEAVASLLAGLLADS